MNNVTWTNWAGTEHCRPEAIVKVESVEQISEVVADATHRGITVRPVGSGHSFAPLVPTDGIVLDLSTISGIESINYASARATVRAGTKIADLGEPLWDAGLCLRNQGAIDAQTIAGAISTSTHGSGLGLKLLSGEVVGAKVVTSSGEVETIGSDDPRLPALRASMGMLGVMVSLDIQLEPKFKLQETLEFRPLAEVLERWEELTHNHRHFSFVHGKQYNMSAALPPLPDTTTPTLVRIFDEVSPDMKNNDSPAHRVNRPHRIYPDQYTPPWEEIEPYVPYNTALDAIQSCLHVLDRFPDEFPLEVRTAAGDDAWLSPTGGTETVSLNTVRTWGNDNRAFFRAMEEALDPFPGRPHWGKQPHLRTADFYRSVFPRWDDFIRLRRQMDPSGTFLNEPLRGLFE